jgi:hypothetical protein
MMLSRGLSTKMVTGIRKHFHDKDFARTSDCDR